MPKTWRSALFGLVVASVALAAPNQPNDVAPVAPQAGDMPAGGAADSSDRAEVSRGGRGIKVFGQSANVTSGWAKHTVNASDNAATGREQELPSERSGGVELDTLPRDIHQASGADLSSVLHQMGQVSVPVPMTMPMPAMSPYGYPLEPRHPGYPRLPPISYPSYPPHYDRHEYPPHIDCASTGDVNQATSSVLSGVRTELADQRTELVKVITDRCTRTAGTEVCDLHPVLKAHADLDRAVDWLKSGQSDIKQTQKHSLTSILDGQSSLALGISSLQTGHTELQDVLAQTKTMLTNGQNAISNGISELAAELKRAEEGVDTGVAQILQDIGQVKEGVDEVKTDVAEGVATLQGGQSDILSDIRDLSVELASTRSDIVGRQDTAINALEGIQTTANDIQAAVDSTKTMVDEQQRTLQTSTDSLKLTTDSVLEAVSDMSTITAAQTSIANSLADIVDQHPAVIGAVSSAKNALEVKLDVIHGRVVAVEAEQSDILTAVEDMKQKIMSRQGSISGDLQHLKEGQHVLEQAIQHAQAAILAAHHNHEHDTPHAPPHGTPHGTHTHDSHNHDSHANTELLSGQAALLQAITSAKSAVLASHATALEKLDVLEHEQEHQGEELDKIKEILRRRLGQIEDKLQEIISNI